MKVVIFSRLPKWYSPQNDRLAKKLTQEGHEVVGIITENIKTTDFIRSLRKKLGPEVIKKKILSKIQDKLKIKEKAFDGIDNKEFDQNSSHYDTSIFRVTSHNSSECEKLLTQLNPEILILKGCGIIKNNILDIPEVGTINPHYAKLPDYRGMDVTEWSVFYGERCEVSIHWVSEAIDTGEVIASKKISSQRGDTLGDLREKSAKVSIELISDAINKIEHGECKPEFDLNMFGLQYFEMHPRIRKITEMRLRKA